MIILNIGEKLSSDGNNTLVDTSYMDIKSSCCPVVSTIGLGY